MEEENIGFNTSDKIFYNPAMKFCRSFFSLAVGAIDEKLDLLDAFSATGIRGIRYKKENKNVKSIAFLDYSKNAVKLIKQNIKKSKIKGKVHNDEFGSFLVCNRKEMDFNFIEIDPFGTPVPYLFDAVRALSKQKRSYLSVTATDMAVLCGSEKRACMRNYHAKSLNNEFTHENGLRIVMKRIIDSASEFNLGITPLVSLSHRHYIKILVKLERNAEKSNENMAQIGYINYCPKCLNRNAGEYEKTCPICGAVFDHAGPLWLGRLFDSVFLKTMKKNNESRLYSDRKEIGKVLDLMIGEADMLPYYYDLHVLSKKLGHKAIPRTEDVLKRIEGVRTHFNVLGFKTKKSFKELVELLND
ncbi:MAG: tRNA (guanine(10)-N(2))-dimethyltransferase [Candidatus Micrarchaeota archaeon]